ncbi:hypothetical protein [Halocola ammonii]
MTNILSYISRIGAVALFTILVASTPGCKYIDKNAAHTEGEIIYDVNFPDQEKSILLNVYPSEMKMSFKDNKLRGKLESIGGLVSSEIVVDTKKKSYWQLLNSFGDKISCELNEEQVAEFITPTQHNLEETGSSEHLEMDCRSYKILTDDGKERVEVLTTEEIEVENPNWYTPFAGAEGVLLKYELEQWGMRMTLTAREIIFKEVSDEQFEIPASYKEISADSMYLHLEELLEEMPR